MGSERQLLSSTRLLQTFLSTAPTSSSCPALMTLASTGLCRSNVNMLFGANTTDVVTLARKTEGNINSTHLRNQGSAQLPTKEGADSFQLSTMTLKKLEHDFGHV